MVIRLYTLFNMKFTYQLGVFDSSQLNFKHVMLLYEKPDDQYNDIHNNNTNADQTHKAK